MAVTPSPPCYISVSFLRHLPPSTTVPFFALSATQRNLGGLTVNRNNLVHNFGDFGARDPYPEEIASQFGDKVLGNQSTEDNIFIPNASAPLSVDDARKPLYKVLGWSIVEDEAGGLKIRCMWKEGLSMNNFIMAAKIDDIKTSDLSPRKRVWA
ncbi:hypothetical protein N665_0084s0019 [Sinapis alba]|nr:hypothetical protein N665_0084s0019 [Sinapis alba]